MEKEIIKGDFKVETYNSYKAKQHVYKHRNIFSKHTTRIIERDIPAIIKEIDTAPDGHKKYWFWCFYPTQVVIYQFEGKPTKKEEKEMWEDIRKDTEKQ